MMSWTQEYKRWIENPSLESSLKSELQQLAGDEAGLEDRFYKKLEFGTAGMRGEISAGTNRMNTYTVRKAAKGLADYVASKGEEAKQRGVVIAYDNRRKSQEFSVEAAAVLGANGVKAYVLKELRPTPVLSFAVRELETAAGVMITASHNPPEYNGFKAYGPDGSQLVPEDADQLISYVNAVEDELSIDREDPDKLETAGLLEWVLESIDTRYNEEMKRLILDQPLINEMGGELSVVFTPLHGTAQVPMMRAFETAGFTNVHSVPKQDTPDTEFSTVSSPNPEQHDAFAEAIKVGESVQADLLIATDPDADRVGLAAKNRQGSYVVFDGNQTGALLLDYLLKKKDEKGQIPDNGIVIKTIVTSEMGRAVAEAYGVSALDVLTGFKFIGEKIRQYEADGSHTFLFGYEESYGYLIEPFARDKDAIQPSLLAAEMAAYYKKHGMSLHDAMLHLYETYGFYYEDLVSYTYKGKEGAEKITRIMDVFRTDVENGDVAEDIVKIEDYHTGERIFMDNRPREIIDLPSSNVLKMFFADGSWFCLRPSGTEPKIKFYFGVKGSTDQAATDRLAEIKRDVLAKVDRI